MREGTRPAVGANREIVLTTPSKEGVRWSIRGAPCASADGSRTGPLVARNLWPCGIGTETAPARHVWREAREPGPKNSGSKYMFASEHTWTGTALQSHLGIPTPKALRWLCYRTNSGQTYDFRSQQSEDQ
jgi:hypothetical protein